MTVGVCIAEYAQAEVSLDFLAAALFFWKPRQSGQSGGCQSTVVSPTSCNEDEV